MTQPTTSWDWKRALPVDEWHALTLDGWPGWDRPANAREPYRASIILVHAITMSARQIALALDDWAQGRFYYRDFTESGLPFVTDGEQYKASFWFERKQDWETFRREYYHYLPPWTQQAITAGQLAEMEARMAEAWKT